MKTPDEDGRDIQFDMQTEIYARDKRIADLEKALEPFVNARLKWNQDIDNNWRFAPPSPSYYLTNSHWLGAIDALKRKGK